MKWLIPLLLLATPAAAQMTAAQMLGQQLGACATAQAELVEKVGKLQVDLDKMTKERDDLKAKVAPLPK